MIFGKKSCSNHKCSHLKLGRLHTVWPRKRVGVCCGTHFGRRAPATKSHPQSRSMRSNPKFISACLHVVKFTSLRRGQRTRHTVCVFKPAIAQRDNLFRTWAAFPHLFRAVCSCSLLCLAFAPPCLCFSRLCLLSWSRAHFNEQLLPKITFGLHTVQETLNVQPIARELLTPEQTCHSAFAWKHGDG